VQAECETIQKVRELGEICGRKGTLILVQLLAIEDREQMTASFE
jgi:hypothetical protein